MTNPEPNEDKTHKIKTIYLTEDSFLESPIPTEIRHEPAELAKKEHNEKFLAIIKKKLDLLEAKASSFRSLASIAKTGSASESELSNAANAIDVIHEKLDDLYVKCKNKELSIQEFKDGVKDFMQTDEAKDHLKTLNTPRGLKAKTIIANIVFAVTLLPFYLIGAAYTGRWGVFQPNTDSKNRVDAAVDSINTFKA